MQKKRLHLYTLDMKYVRDLAKADDKVMSVSPQENKENRPFVGIVVIMDDKKYCIPLTSPKPKHAKMKNDMDFSKMYDKHNKLIGALNFKKMRTEQQWNFSRTNRNAEGHEVTVTYEIEFGM